MDRFEKNGTIGEGRKEPEGHGEGVCRYGGVDVRVKVVK